MRTAVIVCALLLAIATSASAACSFVLWIHNKNEGWLPSETHQTLEECRADILRRIKEFEPQYGKEHIGYAVLADGTIWTGSSPMRAG